MYGTIERNIHGGITLRVENLPKITYYEHNMRMAEKLYRREYGLRYKRITWMEI